jgi:ADP-ribosylglycohydrolase
VGDARTTTDERQESDSMLGTVAGDVIGSVYENRKSWALNRHPNFEPLFAPKAHFTDDTVLTVATAEWLLRGGDLAAIYKDYYGRYSSAGYGKAFRAWARSDGSEPYNSWGNGSAMRVSPVGWACATADEVVRVAKETAAVTHNHPEGVKGARAVALAVFLARSGVERRDIRQEIEGRFGYDLSATVEQIRPTYAFDSSCQGSVPQAIVAFLDATDYESAVRLAVSLGGDADTLAAIAGGIAEAYYGGVPEPIRQHTLARLDDDLIAVVTEFAAKYGPLPTKDSP